MSDEVSEKGGNLLELPEGYERGDLEYFEELFRGPQGLRAERIISKGHQTAAGEWYEQEEGEWVVLLQGEATLVFEGPEKVVALRAGDFLFIEAGHRHRVASTSVEPPCVWLAVHGTIEMKVR